MQRLPQIDPAVWPKYERKRKRPRKPMYFRPAGDVQTAHFAHCPPFVHDRDRRSSGARAAGLRYERKVQLELELRYGDRYLPGAWICFRSTGDTRPRWAQPDGLLFDLATGTITLVEIKLQHTEYSWFQLTQLYLPLVVHMFQPPDQRLWRFRLVEVVRWYDPDRKLPTKCELIRDLREAGSGDPLSVHILKPRSLADLREAQDERRARDRSE